MRGPLLQAAAALLLICQSGCQLLNVSFSDQVVSEFQDSSVPDREHGNSEAPAIETDTDSIETDSDSEAANSAVPSETAENYLPEEMTLEAALHFALANSRDIQVLELMPREVMTGIDVEQARFDPAFASGGQWGRTSQQVESAVQALGTNLTTFEATQFGATADLADQLQLEQQWQTGTRARIGYSTSYNLNDPAGQFLVVNPAWRSGARMTLEQPVFQGASRRINQLGMRIARARYDQSLSEFRAEVNRILHEVEMTWWELYRDRAYADSLEEMLRIAELTWETERARRRLGQNSIAEESQALENLEALRARAAAALSQSTTSEQRFRQKLGLKPQDSRALTLSADPLLEEYRPDLQDGIALALRHRKELKAQQQSVQQSAMELRRQENGMLPAVNLVGSYGLSGLNTGLTQSLGNLSSGDFGDWNLGVTFRQNLGRRAERASVRRAQLAHTRSRIGLRRVQEQVEYEVTTSFHETQAAFTVLQRQTSRQQAARRRFETHQRMYDAGQLDLDRFLRSQEAYVLSQRDYHAAVAQYNLNVHRWFYVTGQLTQPTPIAEPMQLAENELRRMIDDKTAHTADSEETETPQETGVIPAGALSSEGASTSVRHSK